MCEKKNKKLLLVCDTVAEFFIQSMFGDRKCERWEIVSPPIFEVEKQQHSRDALVIERLIA